MKFCYGREELKNPEAAENYRFILGNGLGGYLAMTAAFSANRSDDGILCASVQAPNVRKLLVHRLREVLTSDGREIVLSSQRFADGSEEKGLQALESFECDALPVWICRTAEFEMRRTCAVRYGSNLSVVAYEIRNRTEKDMTFQVEPSFLMEYRGDAAKEAHGLYTCTAAASGLYSGICAARPGCDEKVLALADGKAELIPQQDEILAYPEDGKDGRPDRGHAARMVRFSWMIPAGERGKAELLFAPEGTPVPELTVSQILQEEAKRREALLQEGHFRSEEARELARAADLFLSEKAATGGSTLLAGYPLFGDWGRDTMISMPGCILALGKYDKAKEIFQTFLSYERNGLVPNLFPEKGQEPMYNSVDAPLLLIEGLKLYTDATEDLEFIRANWPVLQRIIRAYRKGTDFAIKMDTDSLISEGQRPWQLTWMDACIDGILPTPRYGKPVEINAYWYNALMIMAEFAGKLGFTEEGAGYSALAEKVKTSFCEQFWLPEKGYLKDLISGDPQTDLQIRCNQIWALTMSYSMLSEEEAKTVLAAVKKHLYTTRGLRSLSPEDPEYHGYYGGPQFDRDMAYHQGTIWVYPLGAYYRAVLKIGHNSPAAQAEVRQGLAVLPEMLKEGCAGQLPEIYDGDRPYRSKGCYAQAWSVGELLRVFAELEA